jgi:uncharacterized protein YjiS (DUF1127 family)
MRVLSYSLPSLPRLRLLKMIGTALAIRRQRQRLLRLDDALLDDIGLTEDQAIAESRRPIWDAPPHWRL